MGYNAQVYSTEDGIWIGECLEISIRIEGESRVDAQKKLGEAISRYMKGDTVIDNGVPVSPQQDTTLVLSAEEVQALKRVLKMVVEGKLDKILENQGDEK
jgi:hypothetical protein